MLNLIYLTPAFVVTDAELETLTGAIRTVAGV
jgi:hypothetical protein